MHASFNIEPKPICFALTGKSGFQIVCQGRDEAIGNLVYFYMLLILIRKFWEQASMDIL
jgi:hypothetical protein